MTSAHSKKRVLIVDDEKDMRIFVSTVVETSGYEALEAPNGEQALELARAELPDLVILDVMMPNIEDGIRTFHQFKSESGLKHIPIIMLSAIARKTFFHYIAILGPVQGDTASEPEAYMEKPPEVAKLIELMKSVLE